MARGTRGVGGHRGPAAVDGTGHTTSRFSGVGVAVPSSAPTAGSILFNGTTLGIVNAGAPPGTESARSTSSERVENVSLLDGRDLIEPVGHHAHGPRALAQGVPLKRA